MLSSPIRLGPSLLVDLPRCVIIRETTDVALEGRDVRLLETLLQDPRCYISIETLAKAVMVPADYENSADRSQCVYDAVWSVRRKLGPLGSSILKSKQGRGYAICPQS